MNVETTTFTLQLTGAQINTILNIVGTRPLAEVLDLFATIKQQADKQIAEQANANK